jgi:putative transposase
MSDKYKIKDKDRPYFLTLTVVGWIDVFSRPNHKSVITDSLKYCQEFKGLEIYGWCLMTNHLHMIAKAVVDQSLPRWRSFATSAIN